MDKIYNPSTGRMVNIDGVIGKKLKSHEVNHRSRLLKSHEVNHRSRLLKSHEVNRRSDKDNDFPLVKSPGDYKEKVKILPISQINIKTISKIIVEDEIISDDYHVKEMIDAFGMEDYDYFTHYEVFVFASEFDKHSKSFDCKISKSGINHAAIRLLATNGQYYTIEWGMLTSNWEIDFQSIVQSEDYWYNHLSYKNGKSVQSIWKGCRALYGKLNKKIRVDDVAIHAVKWNQKLGSVGKSSYPYNCRGYVDSFLFNIVNKGIVDWVGMI